MRVHSPPPIVHHPQPGVPLPGEGDPHQDMMEEGQDMSDDNSIIDDRQDSEHSDHDISGDIEDASTLGVHMMTPDPQGVIMHRRPPRSPLASEGSEIAHSHKYPSRERKPPQWMTSGTYDLDQDNNCASDHCESD